MNDNWPDSNLGTTSRLRLRRFNYADPGGYFVTCVARNREQIFGTVHQSRFRSFALGDIILEEWQALENAYPEVVVDCCQLMPDHFHAVVFLVPGDGTKTLTLSSVIGRFKSLTARRYWQVRDNGACPNVGTTCWQDRFHEKIIRNDQHYEELMGYMVLNPRRWSQRREL